MPIDALKFPSVPMAESPTLSERAGSYHPDGFVIIRFAKNINDRLMVHYMEINVEEIKPIRMAFVRFVTIRGS